MKGTHRAAQAVRAARETSNRRIEFSANQQGTFGEQVKGA
jgi:hypothetical protein